MTRCSWSPRRSGSILDQDVVAGPAVEDVLTRPADQDVVAGAADQRVVAGAADQDVVAVAAVGRERIAPADRPEASTTSSPPRALMVSRSLAASAPVMFTWAARPSTETPLASPATVTTSSPLVPLTMTVSAWPSPVPLPGGPARSRLSCGEVGAGQVVDGDGVGAAQGVEVDRLDAVEVHRDVADVAGEPDALAVGGDVDLLVDVGAVEEHRVDAGLAFDGVAAVAGVPDERVVAGAHERHVVAGAAVDEVVALAADEDVVAVAAVERQADRIRAAGRSRRWCRCPPRALTVEPVVRRLARR